MRRGTLMFSFAADGGVRGRRGEADAARAAAALRQAQGRREEQEALRAPRRARIQPGKSHSSNLFPENGWALSRLKLSYADLAKFYLHIYQYICQVLLRKKS